MKKRILEKFGKMAYRVFLKPYLKRKIKDNNYEWDDKMFKILDKMIREW